ncbi:MAG: hypothetical protein ACKV0T_14235 [Planctomycetales bacterium]
MAPRIDSILAASLPLEILPRAIGEWLAPSLPLDFALRPPDSTEHSKDDTLPRLAPSRPTATQLASIALLRSALSEQATNRGVSPDDLVPLEAGILCLFGDLEGCHTLAQSREGEGPYALADYWHAIMHRREPDFANARYWFRRIGNPPIWEELRRVGGTLRGSPDPAAQLWGDRLGRVAGWDALGFVDLCEACHPDEKSELARLARQIQFQEMTLLLEFTLKQADPQAAGFGPLA